MFSKKVIYLVIFFLITVLTFSACRITGVAEDSTIYNGIVLTYYKMNDESTVMKSLIAEYVKDHPGLVINYKNFVDFDEYQDLVINEMAEGEGPDIFSMPNSWFMSNYRKVSPMPHSVGTPEIFESLFVDVAAKDLVFKNEEGQNYVYGVPMTVDTLAIYYNKAHFEDKIPLQGHPSDTWDGIASDVQKLVVEDESFSRFEVAGIAMGRSENISNAVDILYMLFLQKGLNFYNEIVSESIFTKKQSGIDSDAAAQALKFFTNFSNISHENYSWNENVANSDYVADELDAFVRGDVSMIIGYSSMYDKIINQIDVLKSRSVNVIDKSDVKTSVIPQFEGFNSGYGQRVAYANYFAETVSRNTQHAEIAWDFLVFMSKKSVLETYFDELHRPTSRRDMIKDQIKDPIYGAFVSQLGYAKSFPIANQGLYTETFINVIDNVVGGADAVNELIVAQSKINDLLPSTGLAITDEELIEVSQ